MERVRAKAQSAIDQANAAYSQQRAVLMARFDTLVAFVGQAQQAAAAAQRVHAAAAAQAVAQAAAQQALGGAGAAAAGGKAPDAGAANPMSMLSHAMASQLLSMQAQARAKPAGAQASVAAHPFAPLLAQMGHFSEGELRSQVHSCGTSLAAARCSGGSGKGGGGGGSCGHVWEGPSRHL
jgi:hypothetical protein